MGWLPYKLVPTASGLEYVYVPSQKRFVPIDEVLMRLTEAIAHTGPTDSVYPKACPACGKFFFKNKSAPIAGLLVVDRCIELFDTGQTKCRSSISCPHCATQLILDLTLEGETTHNNSHNTIRCFYDSFREAGNVVTECTGFAIRTCNTFVTKCRASTTCTLRHSMRVVRNSVRMSVHLPTLPGWHRETVMFHERTPYVAVRGEPHSRPETGCGGAKTGQILVP